jgi:hypothetical protein
MDGNAGLKKEITCKYAHCAPFGRLKVNHIRSDKKSYPQKYDINLWM